MSGSGRISIAADRWYLDGSVTYPCAAAEGLLMNVRVVNAVFEDTTRPDFDPDANTAGFIRRVPDYVAHGVRAFTINLQGGLPGYEGACNSAFDADGSLRADYMQRVRRVIAACDQAGAAVILGCFYQRQAHVLRDGDAIRVGVVSTVHWLAREGCANVLLEIANEFGHAGFTHPLLKTEEGQVELVRLAKQAAPDLLVSTSGLGDGRFPANLAHSADFLLIHFNETPLEDYAGRIEALRRYGKPIVCNEDVKVGDQGARAAASCVRHGASWGLMLAEVNQHYPFVFDGVQDDPAVYAQLKALTSAPQLAA